MLSKAREARPGTRRAAVRIVTVVLACAAAPRVAGPAGPETRPAPKGHITFAINTHDFVHVKGSADILLRPIALDRQAVWRAYEQLVACAAANLKVVTSEDIVELAESARRPAAAPPRRRPPGKRWPPRGPGQPLPRRAAEGKSYHVRVASDGAGKGELAVGILVPGSRGLLRYYHRAA